MTETLHRPDNSQTEQLAFRKKRLEQLNALSSQTESPASLEVSEATTENATSETLHRPTGSNNAGELASRQKQLQSIRALSPENHSEPSTEHIELDVNESETPLPRMTPALIEAMQKFAVDSRVAPEDAHDQALEDNRKFDTVALKTLRKENYDKYVDTVVALADQEIAGDLEGRTNRNRLLRENLQTTAEQKLENSAIRAKALGKTALINSSAVAVGLAKKSWKPINQKIYEGKSKRAAKKHMSGLHKEALEENKLRDRSDRRTARRERIEEMRESALKPVRKLGRFALDVRLTGLDTVSPEHAAEIRLKQELREVEAMRLQTETALSAYDLESQSPTMQYLMEEETFKPSQVVNSKSGEGFLSATFSDSGEADSEYALYFAPQGEQLFPYLMKKAKNGEWAREFTGAAVFSQTDKEMIAQAAELLGTSESTVASKLDRSQMKNIRNRLYDTTEGPKKVSHPVSEYAKKREALKEAKNARS